MFLASSSGMRAIYTLMCRFLVLLTIKMAFKLAVSYADSIKIQQGGLALDDVWVMRLFCDNLRVLIGRLQCSATRVAVI
jgi:hypothetical protein